MTGVQAWAGFTAMCVGLFMAVLDIQIVAAALTAHTEIIAIALSGRLARALPTQGLFAGCALGFVVTSLACALSHSFAALIFWRTLQGFFAGVMTPTVFSAGYKMFPRALQARAILLAGALGHARTHDRAVFWAATSRKN